MDVVVWGLGYSIIKVVKRLFSVYEDNNEVFFKE